VAPGAGRQFDLADGGTHWALEVGIFDSSRRLRAWREAIMKAPGRVPIGTDQLRLTIVLSSFCGQARAKIVLCLFLPWLKYRRSGGCLTLADFGIR